MRESDIMHENGVFWVAKDKSGYLVLETGVTHSKTLSTFAKDADGLSLAIAYCDYEARHKAAIDGKTVFDTAKKLESELVEDWHRAGFPKS